MTYVYTVDILFTMSILIGSVMFFTYLTCFLKAYALGEKVHFYEVETEATLNPLRNRELWIVFAFPIIIMIILILISLIWIVSLPAFLIFLPIHYIRTKNIKKKKMWDILKDQ